jgi:cyclic lactone autoinducer peptide
MKKNRFLVMLLTFVSTFGIFAATTSSGACWIWAMHQPECPKSLLK